MESVAPCNTPLLLRNAVNVVFSTVETPIFFAITDKHVPNRFWFHLQAGGQFGGIQLKLAVSGIGSNARLR